MSDEIKKKMQDLLNSRSESPFEATREFLLSYVSDRDSMDEVEADIVRMSHIGTRTLHLGLEGIEKVLANPPGDRRLSGLIACEVGWVLD